MSLNDYVWALFENYWCGFQPEEVAPEQYEKLQEVKEMPMYLDDGSIKVIDGVIVVKFRDKF